MNHRKYSWVLYFYQTLVHEIMFKMAKKTVHHQESLLQKQMTIYFLFAHDDASKVIEFEMKSMARDTKASSEKDFPLLLLWTTSIKDIKGSLTAVFKYDTIQEIRASWNQFRKKELFSIAFENTEVPIAIISQ